MPQNHSVSQDAPDQLLLSESVYRLLNIITYYPKVELLKPSAKTDVPKQSARVPVVRCNFISAVSELSHQSVCAIGNSQSSDRTD